MKNKILFIFLMSACMLTGCFKKTVKGADGTEYENYHECLAAQDFEAAHKFIAIMMKEVLSINDKTKQHEAAVTCLDARNEVLDQEARFLMSQGDEASKKRILYLMQEGITSPVDHLVSFDEKSKWRNYERKRMLMDLAIANDDEDLLKSLAILDSGGVFSSEDVVTIVNYLAEKDTEANKKFIISFLITNDHIDILNGDALISILKSHDIPFANIPKLKWYEDRQQSE